MIMCGAVCEADSGQPLKQAAGIIFWEEKRWQNILELTVSEERPMWG